MKYLKVNLWGNEIGRLVWNNATRRTYFMYNPKNCANIPNIAPLLSPPHTRNAMIPIYGDDRPLYQGLPPFIADSLPDSWGNTLVDKWVKENRIPRNKVTPLYKLMFIGQRGMGALEFEPCAEDLNHQQNINIKSLYDMALDILEDRETQVLGTDLQLTLQALLAVGTSAGGRQMKAIIAINRETGEICSGQTLRPEGYDYYILKFGDRSMPMAEIEVAYFDMATAAGIEMEQCELFPVEGTNHFLTKRFDRKEGRKVHMQTLAAINPDACSYEDLVATCRELSITEAEIEQLFLRMVFNVLANNTDDHNKNFSFLLATNGQWRIAPAYDVTFIFNTNGTGPHIERRLSIGGKTAAITKEDLIDFARHNGIKNAHMLITRVATALSNFETYAERRGITQPWRSIIQKTITENLIAAEFVEPSDTPHNAVCCSDGRTVTDFAIAINSKGHFEVSANINGTRNRRFVRPNMNLYHKLKQLDIFNLSSSAKATLIEQLFSPV